jgi:hypothetical protein
MTTILARSTIFAHHLVVFARTTRRTLLQILSRVTQSDPL